MILDEIVDSKIKRLAEHKALVNEARMKELAMQETREVISFYSALAKPGLSIIGEFKKASPSHGNMKDVISLEDRIAQYNNAVDAISVLTEEDHFHGGTEYLRQIRRLTQLPIIRKDFIIEDYQVYEARVIGADAILLIAAILDDERFRHLYELAYKLGMDVLCEVHDKAELERMLALGVKIIGINNRNLKNFEVDFNTTGQLAAMVAAGNGMHKHILVSESGVLSDDDMRALKQSSVHAALIGTALMESENPQKLAEHWKNIYNENSI